MSNIAIYCESLSKRYRIGERPTNSFREALMNRLATPLRRGHKRTKGIDSTMWALRDISVEVREGEVVGIIGRNGAGKSTLLKVLSRITEPTQGFAEVRGRVGSLLEVGTGFHPELTGRENIYLNGAILGMRKAEIARKFDEIVAFAEIDKFLDTPVKRYSSGMYVRLAFAVAAHLETEILLVDEVLAVGDAQFQRKCMGRMSTVAHQGRTILFVSHNMGAVNRLCSRCVWVDQGRVRMVGPTSEVVNAYLDEGAGCDCERSWPEEAAPGAEVRLRGARICQPAGQPTSVIDIRNPFEIEIDVDVVSLVPETSVGLLISGNDGQTVLHSSDLFAPGEREVRLGRYRSTCVLPSYALNAGTYTLTVGADVPNQRMIFYEENVMSWSVAGTCPVMGRYGGWRGYVGPGIASWKRGERE